MTTDEVPKGLASFVGHVCGVIAVGMTVLSLFVINGLVHRFTWAGFVFALICIGLGVLMFRWAGVLTGYWHTPDRLAVPKNVYVVLGAVFTTFSALVVGFAFLQPPKTLDEGLVLVFGLFSSIGLTYMCYLATERFK